MEEIKNAILQIAAVYDEITQLLAAHSPSLESATFDMLRDGKSVAEYTKHIASKDNFSINELNLVLGVTKGFSRHLSEVEQTVYEEIGGEQLDKLKFLISEDRDAYNYIWHYRKDK